ncbi:MAG: selenide, water dikinase SelD [Bacteroidetes bacterium]|nr:MAG: selenide, water dikinase SelD [Bacteroidota bacterium]
MEISSTDTIKLTQYSHGAGCGCKISPQVLDQILKTNLAMPDHKNLIVGNHSKDDAAVFNLGNGTALISTTDFFMPIVDDPYNFGRIAAANAISDVYAMGGKPIVAIAILGWPINTLSPEIAQKVIEGGRSICIEAGIPLAGGHSIDSPEPIFGLAVNGIVDNQNIKQNDRAEVGDLLFLTKPLGVGILTTAEKKGILLSEDEGLAAKQMMQLNKVGEALGKVKGVSALTDVTGFGLLGHLIEMAEGSHTTAEISMKAIPLINSSLKTYIDQNAVPGGTIRNKKSYEHKIGSRDLSLTQNEWAILADPQTSGGLLVSVNENSVPQIVAIFEEYGLGKFLQPIGRMLPESEKFVIVLP